MSIEKKLDREFFYVRVMLDLHWDTKKKPTDKSRWQMIDRLELNEPFSGVQEIFLVVAVCLRLV